MYVNIEEPLILTLCVQHHNIPYIVGNFQGKKPSWILRFTATSESFLHEILGIPHPSMRSVTIPPTKQHLW